MKGDLDSYFTFTVGWKQFHVADGHKNVTLNKTGHKTDKKNYVVSGTVRNLLVCGTKQAITM